MDEYLHTDDAAGSHSTSNAWGSEPYAGAFFPNSCNFVIEGGVFTSNVTNVTHNHHIYPALQDFRKIPMGEIDLQHEIQFDHDSGVVHLRRGKRCARRVYSARIDGCKTAVTVAWYQGPNAEQAWRQDISMHSSLRHPNLVQLYGVANTSSMHAAVFHDDLIPLEQFIDIHRNSPILSCYFRAYWSEEFYEVNRYLESMVKRNLDEDKCTLWIRGSNRRLCVDDMILNNSLGWCTSYFDTVDHWKPGREAIDIMSYKGPNHEAVAISSLALSDYHKFCGLYSSHSQSLSLPAHATATIGMVVKHHSSNREVESPVNITFTPLLDVGDTSCGLDEGLSYGWCGPGEPEGALSVPWLTLNLGCVLMPDSWRRYNLREILVTTDITRPLSFDYEEFWLGQANHIFSSLQIKSDHNQYVVVQGITFQWVFSPSTGSNYPSQGWLFICPDAQLRSGPCSFRWPECAAYWSRDPFGAVRLSTEEAEEAGFPSIKLKSWIRGKSWDATDYAALWQFHQAKGFAPDSQEVARHLGHPLYQLCDDLAVEAPFGHVTSEGIAEDNTDQHDTLHTSPMSDEDKHETVNSENGDEDERPGRIQADILALSRGFRLSFKLLTVILALVVFCCPSYTAYYYAQWV